jgi:hypothetical protein
MKCPSCGYEDPFIPSWYVPWQEIAEPWSVNEWQPWLFELLEIKSDGDVVYEDYVYHRTPSSVERMPRDLSIEYHTKGFPPQEKAHRKNYHILGKQVAQKMLKEAKA